MSVPILGHHGEMSLVWGDTSALWVPNKCARQALDVRHWAWTGESVQWLPRVWLQPSPPTGCWRRLELPRATSPLCKLPEGGSWVPSWL